MTELLPEALKIRLLLILLLVLVFPLAICRDAAGFAQHVTASNRGLPPDVRRGSATPSVLRTNLGLRPLSGLWPDRASPSEGQSPFFIETYGGAEPRRTSGGEAGTASRGEATTLHRHFVCEVEEAGKPAKDARIEDYEGRQITAVEVVIEGSAADPNVQTELLSLLKVSANTQFSAVRVREFLQSSVESDRILRVEVDRGLGDEDAD